MKPVNLPRQLARMTPEQVEAVIEYLMTLPLSELRARQALDDRQIERAWASPARVPGITIENLQIDQELVAEAISRQHFTEQPRRTIDVSRWLA
jgi:hypothetical protein